jgi:hypothetical protein
MMLLLFDVDADENTDRWRKLCRNLCGRLEALADFEVPHARFASRAEPMVVKHSSLFGMAVGLLVGFGLPHLEVARACLRPISEGCVWGRSLIAVNIIATLILVGLDAATPRVTFGEF